MVLPSISFVIATLFALSTAAADMVAHHCTGPTQGRVQVIKQGNACTGYRVEQAGRKPLQVDFDFTGSGTLLASRDGRTVVMIQSYLYGRIDHSGDIVEFVGAAEIKHPKVVYVYRDGRLVASHAIDDLLARKELVGQTTSHVRWVRAAPTRIGKTFTLTTSSYRTITFDAKTGAITRQDNAPEWDRCELIASGTLDLRGNRLTKAFSLKTQQPVGDLAFVRAPGLALTDRASATVCLERRGKLLELTEEL
jgi:hypothetical protein